MIKVLIVDDSSFMRVKIRSLLESDTEIKVIGIARNGMDALQKTAILKPDVITMDINMPDISGLKAVELIMKQYPTPIIMISSLTYHGAYETLEALEKGAIDYIHKEQLSEKLLIEKIFIAKNAKLNTSQSTTPGVLSDNSIENVKHSLFSDDYKAPHNNSLLAELRTFSIVGIGISTGGPKALAQLVPKISPNLPASIVIAQHMLPTFTKPLAERLNNASALRVKEAEEGERLIPGYVYICPGGKHIMIEDKGIISLNNRENFADYLYCPSASLLMSSISRVYGANALCIIMTGMGSDGLEGITESRKRGSYILAQSESSCTIYGMPKAVISNNLQDEVVELNDIADRINQLCLDEQ